MTTYVLKIVSKWTESYLFQEGCTHGKLLNGWIVPIILLELHREGSARVEEKSVAGCPRYVDGGERVLSKLYG